MKNKKIYFIVSLCIFILGALSMFNIMKDKKSEITSVSVMSMINAISDLSVVEYRYTDVGIFENHNEFYGIKIPLTAKRFIISYDGIIKSGIDVKAIKVKVSENNINLKLPKAEIKSHEILEESIKILDEKNAVFNPIKLNDYTSFAADRKKINENRALEKGILLEADTNAKKLITEILNAVPQIKDEYTITFD